MSWRTVKGRLLAILLIGTLISFGVRGQSGAGTAHERTAEIVNSGSTNRAGYRIIIRESGWARYVPGKPRYANGPQGGETDAEKEADISGTLTRKFFKDVDRASPLSQLPVVRCLKSASFGTTTSVISAGQRSPDVSCPDEDPRMEELYKDAEAIREAVRSARPQ